MATKQVPFKLTVVEVPPEPDFFPAVAPLDQTVFQGVAATYAISFEPVAGFAGLVMLTVSGLPDGFIGTFDVNPIGVGQTATLTIATSDMPLGTYDLVLETTA